MAPSSQPPKPDSWSVIAIVFIALFVLLLSALALVVGYLFHQRKQRKNINPHPYGSEDWLDHERMTATQAERDALAIATLESRIAVQEQYNQEADRMIELLDRSQKNLTLQLRDEQRKSEPIDPEVFQRIYDEIHKPLEPPRPSLPPLVVKSAPIAQPISPAPSGAAVGSPSAASHLTFPAPSAAKSSPSPQPVPVQPLVSQRAPVLLQTTKLQGIMRNNLRPGPARPVRFVNVKPMSATLVDPDEFEVVDLSDDDDKPAPSVGEKPSNFQAR